MRSKKLTFILLSLIILFFVVNHVYYLSLHNVYISGDQHQYVGIAVEYLRLFADFSTNTLDKYLYASAHRPPIYPTIVAISYSIFGLSNPTFYGAIVNSIFLVILGLSIFGIAYHFFKRSIIALTAVIVGFSFPLQVILSRQVMTELPLTALIALTVYFLLKSDNFKNNKYLIFASIAFAASLLTRFTAGFFLFLPVGFMLFQYIKNSGFKGILKKFALPVFIGVIIPVLFYIHNHKEFLVYVYNNRTYGPTWSPHSKFSLESILWYPLDLGEVLTLLLFALLIIGFIVGLFKLSKYSILYLWIFSAYLFFTFVVSFKSDRFIMPIYPALAVLIVLPLSKIKLIKNIVFPSVFISAIALFVFIYTTWGVGPFAQIPKKQAQFFQKKIIYSTLPYSKPPSKKVESTSNLYKLLVDDAQSNKIKYPSVIFTISIEDINKVIYEGIKYKTLDRWVYLDSTNQNLLDFKKMLNDADYIIAKDNGDTYDAHHPFDRVKLMPEINNEFLEMAEDKEKFMLISSEEYIDGSKLLLYRNIKSK